MKFEMRTNPEKILIKFKQVIATVNTMTKIKLY